MNQRFTDDELDVLLYIASYLGSYRQAPTQRDLQEKCLKTGVVKDLIGQGFLTETEGRIWPVKGMVLPQESTLRSGL